MRFDLCDEEWAVIEPLLPKAGRGPRRVDDRRVLNGIFDILRTGAPWRDLPERYGARTTVYNRYARWARRGIWKAIFDGLAEHSGDSPIFIDSSIVKAHRAAAGAKGRHWRRLSAAHAAAAQARFTPAVDQHGRPRRFVVTGGQVHDGQVLADLPKGAGAPLAVVADKAYGSRVIRQLIADDGALAVIPSKSNAAEPIPHDPGLYKMRNIVERFFCTMKDMPRLATRFEKLSQNFLAMVHIFAIRLWIN